MALHRVLVTAICLFAAAFPLAAQSAAPPNPCPADSNRHRFDFWIGEWDVSTPDGKPQGHSVVQSISGGCALLENWSDLSGRTGKSINAYNPARKMWQQFWAGEGGAVTEYRDSEWVGDTLVYRGTVYGPKGGAATERLSFSRLPDGSVRQFSQISTDDGRTWKVSYDYIYRKKS